VRLVAVPQERLGRGGVVLEEVGQRAKRAEGAVGEGLRERLRRLGVGERPLADLSDDLASEGGPHSGAPPPNRSGWCPICFA